MRINPYYYQEKYGVSPDELHLIDIGYNPTRDEINPKYVGDGKPHIPYGDGHIIPFGLPVQHELPKKELIKNVIKDPEKRKEAAKAALLEKESGAKETPISDVLIKTKEAHQSAMTATSAEEVEAIAISKAEEVVENDKKITFKKLFNNSTFTLVVGVVATIVVFKYLSK